MLLNGSLLQYFASVRNGRITLPARKKVAPPIECLLSYEPAEGLLVHFPEQSANLGSLDLEGVVFLTCEGVNNTVVHLTGQISRILGDHDLQVALTEVQSYPQRRRFFRIDAEIFLKYWPMNAPEPAPCEVGSKLVNLSAVGLRFHTNHFARPGEHFGLEMTLPLNPAETVNCKGKVVRIDFNGDETESVALDLMGVSSTDQEKIIRFCLVEQRRQIRLKVKVLDPQHLP